MENVDSGNTGYIRHRMKTNKDKAIHNTTKTSKMISYTNPTIKPGVNSDAHKG